MPAITVAMRTEISQLYVALFGRAPDGEGLGFWVKSYADGKTFAKIAQEMFDTAPARDYYPAYNTPSENVTTFYKNVLGRNPDAEGLTFWVKEYIAATSQGAFFEKLLNNVVNYNGTNSEGIASKALFSNKVAVAQFYGEQNGTVAGATAALKGVTSAAASVDTAKAAILNPVSPVQTFTLTSSAPSVAEGNSGTSTLTYVLTLDKAPTSAVTINYQTLTTGTATGGTDYTVAAGIVTFAVGQTVATVSVTVAGDTTFEANETIITSFSGTQLAATVTATGTITNDDVDPQIAINAADATATTTYNTALATYNTAVSTAATALAAANTANAAYDSAAAAATSLAAANAASTLAATSATAAAAAVTAATAQTAAANALTTAAAATLSTADNTVASSAVSASTTAASNAANAVTNAATDTAAAATLVASYTPQAFPLTTGANPFTGGAGADTFDGSLGGAGGNLATLGSADVLNGAGGTDTLTATLTGGTTTPTLTSIENLNITGTAAATLDLINSSGYQVLTSEGTTVGALTFANISSTAAALKVSNSGVGATFGYVAAAVAGTTDSEDLTLTNVTNAALVTIGDIETISVTSAGTTANSINLAAANATTVNVSGANALTLAGVAAATTINASTMTGALTTTLAVAGSLTGGSGNDALTGSAGNDVLVGNAGNNTITAAAGIDTITAGAGTDRIVFAAAGNLTVADSVDAGAGVNTLVATAVDIDTNSDLVDTADLTALARISNIQILEVSGAGVAGGTDVLIDASRVASTVTTINSGAVAGNATTFTFNTGTSALNLSGALGAATHVLVAAGTGVADAVTVTNTNTAAADTFAARALTLTGIETLNINTGATATAAQSTGAMAAWTPTTANATVTLNVTGVNAFTTGVITPAGDNLVVINGSGMTPQAVGTSTLTTVAPVASATGTVSIVGSEGQDSLIGDINSRNTINGGGGIDTITGGSANDSLSGGAGNDSITAAAGIDTVLGGDNDDRIIFATAGDLTVADSVDGGTGVNTLSISAADVATNEALVDTADLTALARLTNIQAVEVTDVVAQAINVARIAASVTTVNTVAATTGAATFTFNTGASTLNLGTAANSGLLGAATTLVAAGTGTADSLTVVKNNTSATDDFNAAALTLTGIETINLNIGPLTALAGAQDIGTIAFTPTTTNAAMVINLSGADDATLAAVTTTGTGLLTINASGLTIATGTTFNLTAPVTTGGTVSIVGSAGNDLLVGDTGDRNTIDGGALNDTITGGTGADSLVGGTGIDQITGGGGNDTISGGAGNDVLVYTITGTDIVNINGDGDDDGLTLTGWNLVTSEDVIAGGTGNDTLTVAVVNATTGSAANVTGWETLVITTAGPASQAMTTVMTADTTINRVDFTGAGDGDRGLTSASANLATLRIVDNAGTLSVVRAVNTTSDSLTFGAATDANMTLAALTVNNEESLTFNAGASVGDTMQVTALNAAQVTTLTITGAQTSTVTTVAASDTATGFGTTARAITINAAAATGTVSVTAATALATQALTMTGSATAANTLTGGLGADSITGGAVADSLTGGAGIDTISGLAGNDSLFGDAANDVLTGGEGADIIRGGTGWDTITLTETTSAADRIDLTTAVAGVSEAFGQSVNGLANDTGGDNVTGMTWGTDTIRVTATNVVAFVHGTHTAIGTAGDVNDGTVGSFLTNVGLIDFAQAASANAGNYTGTDDVAITFTTPSATMTEALFEAALQYVITGTGAANTITGGALADTIDGGAGADVLNGGLGVDQITSGADTDNIIVNVGGSGAVTTTTVANPALVNVAGLDIYTVTATDTITILSAADAALTFTAYVENEARDTEAAVNAAGGAITLGSAGFVMTYTGTYNAGTGFFTTGAQAAVTDLLVVYDTDGTGAGTTFQGIVLVGVDDVSITNAGVITSLAAVV